MIITIKIIITLILSFASVNLIGNAISNLFYNIPNIINKTYEYEAYKRNQDALFVGLTLIPIIFIFYDNFENIIINFKQYFI